MKLSRDSIQALAELKANTKLTYSLVSEYTDKEFIGQVGENEFKIISSEIGRGAFCVFLGEFKDHQGQIHIRLHNVFKVMLSIMITFWFFLTLLSGFKSDLGSIIDSLPLLIFGLLAIRFIFIELSFRFVAGTGMRKLRTILGVVELSS